MSDRECAGDEVTDWEKAHATLLQLARERSELEGREGRALLRAMRSRVHVHLGHGSFVEYVERLFGYSPRTTLDKLRTAEALEALPELDHALTAGELTWSAARELARVATAETERDWLEASKGRTVRDIERLVAGHDRGDRPDDAARPLTVRHVLRFEVAAETLATFRHAMQELRRQSGEHLDDDTALLLMARHVLGSEDVVGSREPTDRRNAIRKLTGADAGRASYQLALTVCEHCRRGFQDAGGERLEVDAAIVQMARCDAQHIGRVGEAAVASESATSRPATPSHVGEPAMQPHGMPSHVRHPATLPQVTLPHATHPATQTQTHVDPPHVTQPATQPHVTDPSTQPHVGLPHVTHPATQPHVGLPDVTHPATQVTHRATQTIPPALRRHVLCRDQGRCVVPGCRHTTFVDLHHIQPRADGGRHDTDNLAVFCSAHHRAVHRGQLIITGRASTGLRFEHADGTPYGHAPSPHTLALLEQVFRGLRGLGFKEREARRALFAASEELRATEVAPAAQELLRAALRRLGPRSATAVSGPSSHSYRDTAARV